MRGYESFVTNVRKQVFTEVARLAYEGGDYSRMEEIPYKIVPGEIASHRESIFLERAIAGERVRLAMGLPLRPITELRPLSEGVNDSAIAEKYYDPPLINIIQYACHACPTKQVRVSERHRPGEVHQVRQMRRRLPLPRHRQAGPALRRGLRHGRHRLRRVRPGQDQL